MFRRILVPVDGSDAGSQGLAEALRLAAPWGATLQLLHVTCADPLAFELSHPAEVDGHRRSLRTRADHLLDDARQRAAQHGVAVEADMRELRRGTPASAIVEAAASSGCDLIVMGTHGRIGVARALAATNAEEVVRKSPVPVLVVRCPKAPRRRAAASSTAVKGADRRDFYGGLTPGLGMTKEHP